MPHAHGADTIRVLVASDNHVGYAELDHERGDDSWKAFDEIMTLAKDRDVDMVLLAGDLFHENKPSRKSMYHVMQSLRANCYGDKPCELEMLSDASENFDGTFNHANYEDQDINVAIPVFSIHGNHDDPSGEGHFAALDLLQISGLINYYGKTPESDNIEVKPVLLQKGRSKLALYGLSNVRDERLYRTFQSNGVKFFRPSTQKDNWFNLLSVHQNHHKYSETGYLPEEMLPGFMDLVVWGHEHECLIDPRKNPDTGFHVMQPGSSIATSLVSGEAVSKHVAILSITGKDFECETIPLKSVRPFIMREIVLQEEPGMKTLARKDNNRTAITGHLDKIVHEMIAEANESWRDNYSGDTDEEQRQEDPPLPLIRLRVEYTAPEGGKYDVENPQRFSNRFVDQVANKSDVVQFHRKKATIRRLKDGTELPNEEVMEQLSIDTVKVDKLVREYLAAQSLSVFPQTLFGDAVSQFIDKDDKHAMELFVDSTLDDQAKKLMKNQHLDEENTDDFIKEIQADSERLAEAGQLRNSRKRKMKPKPPSWDSDVEGSWADQPAAVVLSENEEAPSDGDVNSRVGSVPPRSTATRGRGRGRAKTTGTTRASSAASKATTTKVAAKAKSSKKVVHEDEDDDEDIMMLDDYVDEAQGPPKSTTNQKATGTSRVAASSVKKPLARAAATRQSTLGFSSSNGRQTNGKKTYQEISDDEISDDDDDDDDAFEAAPSVARSGAVRR